MKIEIQPAAFRPVVITIETLRELEGLIEVANKDLRGTLPDSFVRQLEIARSGGSGEI